MLIKQAKCDKLTYKVFDNRTAMGEDAAKDVAAAIKKLLAEKTAAFGAQIHNSGGSKNRNEHRRGAEKILSMLKIVRDKAHRDFEHRRKRNTRQKRRKPRRFAAPLEHR